MATMKRSESAYATYIFVLLLNLSITFITTIATRNGNILFVIWLLSSALMLILYKQTKVLIPYHIALLINNVFIEYKIMLLGGITLTAIIKVIFIMQSFLLFNKKKNSIIIYPKFFAIWTLYFFINSLITNTNGIGNILFSVCFPMSVCIVTQIVAKEEDIAFDQIFIAGIVAALIMMVSVGYVEIMCNKTFFYSIWTGDERFRYGIIRVGTTAADPNFACLSEVFLLLVVNIPCFKRIIGNRVCSILNVATIVQIVLLFSRTGYIALACAAAIVMLSKKNKTFYFLLPIIAVSIAFLTNVMIDSLKTVNEGSYLSRTRIIQYAFEIWRNNPIWGIGHNGFYNLSAGYLGLSRSTMNEYMSQLVNYGVIGLLFYLFFLCLIYKGIVGKIENIFKVENPNTKYFFAMIIVWFIMGWSLDIYSKIFVWIIPAVFIIVQKHCVVKE